MLYMREGEMLFCVIGACNCIYKLHCAHIAMFISLLYKSVALYVPFIKQLCTDYIVLVFKKF